ncbi:DUF4124 domain-containing protein [Acinetobacter guillouiae]|uniref:DUF4124 domain-containing protein n=1 Tax=Acinetobacter guillouiae TaxID=106649 RepID=UPI001F2ED5F7|nr:DUF4124 domain-containing protein [Acinetobacter guillouiae]
MKQILGLWLLFYIPTTLAEVYTCVYKGNTVYQGKPCAGTVAKNNINYSQKSLTDSQKYEQWKSTREPKVGMSGDQVIKTTRWGAPEKKRSFSSNRGKDELWYYPELGLISLKNGVVTSISQ